MNKVEKATKQKMESLGKSGGDVYCMILATFDDSVVVCCRNWDTDSKACYQVGYTMGTDGDVTIGDMQEVTIEPQILPKVDSAMKHLQPDSVESLLRKAFAKAAVSDVSGSLVQFAVDSATCLKSMHDQKQIDYFFSGCETR
jgi:hypothetical protein